jgi:hypothetical protein
MSEPVEVARRAEAGTVIRSAAPPTEASDDDLAAWWYREFVRMWAELEPRYRSVATWRVGQALSKSVGSLLVARLAILMDRPPELEPELIGAWVFGLPVTEAPGQDFVTLTTEHHAFGWPRV